MSFPRYPKYKHGGVEWLPEVPAHWQVQRARWLFEIKKRIAGELGHDVLSITQKGVKVKDTESNDGQISMDYSKYQLVEVGDFAMNHMDLLTGWVDLSAVSGVTSPDYRVFTVRDPNRGHDRYLLYVLQMGYTNKILFAYGQGSSQLGRWRLPTEQFNDLLFPLPPAPEQRAIAAFLDRETAKIDALVAEQERLIDLLKEKRQAVISHAVTKGLNPNAPMKDSGIEGLGQVPAHWAVRKMKWVAKMESGHTPDKKVPEYWEGGQIPWVSLNDTGYLKDHEFITDTAFQITQAGIANSSAHLLPAYAVVFSRDATIGRCAITTRSMAVSQHFIAWICGPLLLPEFLLLRLRSMTQELDRLTTGATIRTIGMPEVRTLMTPLPAIEEQAAIVAHCKAASAAVDAFVAEAERAVGLLLERRTALISAAVTGQIDVRPEAMRTAA